MHNTIMHMPDFKCHGVCVVPGQESSPDRANPFACGKFQAMGPSGSLQPNLDHESGLLSSEDPRFFACICRNYHLKLAQSTEVDQIDTAENRLSPSCSRRRVRQRHPRKRVRKIADLCWCYLHFDGLKMCKKHVSCSSSSFWISQVCQSPQTPSSLAQINCWSSRWQSGTRRKPIKMNSARRR